MEEQMKEQFAKFQNGMASAASAGSKTALRSNAVLMDSFGQLLKDQVAFGRTCMDIGRKQMETLSKDNDVTALFSDKGVSTDYYAAASKYGEALRKNSEDTFKRMTTVSREATDTFAKACVQD